MNKTDLVKYVSDKIGITEVDSAIIVDVLLDGIKNALKEDMRVKLKNFGSFHIQNRKARIAYDPRNRDKLNVPAKKIVKFIMSKKLVDMLNKE